MNKQRIVPKPRKNTGGPGPSLDDIISQGTDFPDKDGQHHRIKKTDSNTNKNRVGRPPSRIKKTKILLSIPDTLLKSVDEYLDHIAYPGSRSDWLQIAIEEKLKKSQK